jgi:hypothetical protein
MYKFLFPHTALIIISLTFTGASCLLAVEPKLLLTADSNSWNSPIYSPTGTTIAYTNGSQQEIWIIDSRIPKPRMVAAGERIGRRFVFDPGLERLVYREQSMAMPDKPIRLLSTSYFLYDPTARTSNRGLIIGPYLLEQKLWYRRSTAEPLLDSKDMPRKMAPYLNKDTGKFWVINEKGDTVYSSTAENKFAAMEIAPDGKLVAVVQDQPEPILSVINMTDGQFTKIGTGEWPSWSGDSHSLIYLVHSGAGTAPKTTELRVFNVVAGQSRTILSSVDYQPETPSLNTDGSRALFASNGALYELTVNP